MTNTLKPIPIKTILNTIEDILKEGTGQEFDLEIYERPYYSNPNFNAITIELRFKRPTAPVVRA